MLSIVLVFVFVPSVFPFIAAVLRPIPDVLSLVAFIYAHVLASMLRFFPTSGAGTCQLRRTTSSGRARYGGIGNLKGDGIAIVFRREFLISKGLEREIWCKNPTPIPIGSERRMINIVFRFFVTEQWTGTFVPNQLSNRFIHIS